MTDFELFGLSNAPLDVQMRYLLLTVDFEAFRPEFMTLWNEAMHSWSEQAQQQGLPFCVFLSVEDVVKLRVANTKAHDELAQGMRAFDSSGMLFYPHNHRVIDVDSGADRVGAPINQPPKSYTKRSSMFFDVVYRHQISLSDWLSNVHRLHNSILKEVRCKIPRVPVFRAGGWDYGSTIEDLDAYMNALKAVGFRIDSSACSGSFNTPTWRIGARYGSNCFKLKNDLVEIAPCLSISCGNDRLIHGILKTLYELREHARLWTYRPGCLVLVFHFDHLFHQWSNENISYFSIKDIAVIRQRIKQMFRLIQGVKYIFALKSATFDDLGL